MQSGDYRKAKCGLEPWFTEYIDNQYRDVDSFPSGGKKDVQEAAQADGIGDCMVIVPVTPDHIPLLCCEC